MEIDMMTQSNRTNTSQTTQSFNEIAVEQRCQYKYKHKCYFVTTTEGNFHDMRKFCKEKQMEMITIESEEELEFFLEFLNRGKVV